LEVKSHGANAIILQLDQEPLDKNQIFVQVILKVGNVVTKYYHDDGSFSSHFKQYRSKGKNYEVTLRLNELIKFLQSHGATAKTSVIYSVQYAVKQ
jgi:hypothetical protein